MYADMHSKLHINDQNPNSGISAKFPYLANHFYIICPNVQKLNDVIDTLRTHTFRWEDPTLQASKELFLKRHKSLQLRMVGKFRHFFYDAVQDATDGIEGLVINGQRQCELRIVGGVLYIFQNHDSIPLLHFTKELIKDNTGVDPDFDGFKLYGFEPPQVETIIEACLLAAEDEVE